MLRYINCHICTLTEQCVHLLRTSVQYAITEHLSQCVHLYVH